MLYLFKRAPGFRVSGTNKNASHMLQNRKYQISPQETRVCITFRGNSFAWKSELPSHEAFTSKKTPSAVTLASLKSSQGLKQMIVHLNNTIWVRKREGGKKVDYFLSENLSIF